MAVANTKSNIVTNADGTSYASSPALYKGGYLLEQAATLETVATDSAASVYRLFRIPSNARVSQILTANDAITGLSTADLGVYQTAANGGAVVSASLFASAVDLTSAHALTDNTYEATATNIDKIEKTLWELLGLSVDPQREYDIAWTATTNAPTAAGTLSGLCRYIVN